MKRIFIALVEENILQKMCRKKIYEDIHLRTLRLIMGFFLSQAEFNFVSRKSNKDTALKF